MAPRICSSINYLDSKYFEQLRSKTKTTTRRRRSRTHLTRCILLGTVNILDYATREQPAAVPMSSTRLFCCSERLAPRNFFSRRARQLMICVIPAICITNTDTNPTNSMISISFKLYPIQPSPHPRFSGSFRPPRRRRVLLEQTLLVLFSLFVRPLFLFR